MTSMKKILSVFSQYRGLRKEIYVLFFGRVVTNLGSMVWPMLTLILSRKLGFKASSISLLMTAAMLIMVPANLLGGRLADRCNKKNVIVLCDLVSIAGYFACGLIPLGILTIGLMFLASVFQSMEYPSYNALFADLTSTRDRERAYSLEYLGANLGLVLSPTIAGLLFQNYLWLSFLISGFAIGCSTALIFFLVRDLTPEPDEGEEAVYQQSREQTGIIQILRENKLLLFYLGIVALYYASYGQYNFLMPLDMGTVHGESGAVIFGTVSSLNCIVVVLFTPLITRVFHSRGEPVKIFLGEVLIFCGYLIFLMLLGFIPIYYLSMLFFTWGEIFVTIAEGPYLSRRIPASHRGRINGVTSVIGSCVGGGINLIVGFLYDGIGSAAAWSLVLGLLAVAVALTFFLIIRDRRVYPKLYEAAQETKESKMA